MPFIKNEGFLAVKKPTQPTENYKGSIRFYHLAASFVESLLALNVNKIISPGYPISTNRKNKSGAGPLLLKYR
jgi:hypothetical protein